MIKFGLIGAKLGILVPLDFYNVETGLNKISASLLSWVSSSSPIQPHFLK